jgi:rod shape determining protein RodA
MLILLISVFVVGVAINSSKRWISVFGFFTIQPSEFVKIALILVLAWVFQRKDYEELGKFLFATLFLIPVAAIVFAQPDMGTSLVFAFIYFLVLAFSLSYKYWLTLVFVVIAAIPFLPNILKDYQMERILTFFDPYRDPLGSGYNVLQSITAVGSGKIFGKGILNSNMTKLNFVPVQYADFIFSAVGEIWGFLGTSVVVICYAYILYFSARAYSLTENQLRLRRDNKEKTKFVEMIMINIGMCMGMMPVTGIPAPFLSFGGSAMIVNFIALGLVTSIYNYKDEINL